MLSYLWGGNKVTRHILAANAATPRAPLEMAARLLFSLPSHAQWKQILMVRPINSGCGRCFSQPCKRAIRNRPNDATTNNNFRMTIYDSKIFNSNGKIWRSLLEFRKSCFFYFFKQLTNFSPLINFPAICENWRQKKLHTFWSLFSIFYWAHDKFLFVTIIVFYYYISNSF